MAAEHPLDRVVQVLEQVEPISDLHRLGCPLPRPLGVRAPAVAAHDLHLGMRREPGRERLGGAVRQQIDDRVRLQVDEDGAIMAPLARRKVVDAEDPDGARRLSRAMFISKRDKAVITFSVDSRRKANNANTHSTRCDCVRGLLR